MGSPPVIQAQVRAGCRGSASANTGASTAAGEAVLLRHDTTRDGVVTLASLHIE